MAILLLASYASVAVGSGGGGGGGGSGTGLTLKGIEYVSWWKGEYSSANSDTSLTDLKNINSNSVGLIVTWYMDTGTDSTIKNDSSSTPTDADIVHAISDIHGRGMSVVLKPHIDIKDGTWRGSIAPSNITGWFSNYSNFITHYAQIAKNNSVEYFVVGTELKSLSGSAYSSNWNTIIDNIKAIYTGPLTYASNWDEYTSVSFWNRLDYGGIDAYFPLSDAQNPSVPDLMNGWSNYSGTYGTRNWVTEIESWQATINKPVIFTEIGYRSVDYAAKRPWDWNAGGTYNGQLQANCYQAAIQVFQNKTWFTGMYWWDWLTDPNAGGTGNTDYTPQNKPAEATLTTLYGGTVIPNSISNLTASSGATWLNFTWLNPPDIDFSHVMLYLNGTFITNVSAPQNFYNFTGLLPDTSYELGTRTVDASGNINSTWVNHTARTAPAPDILSYYRSLGSNPDIVETTDLLKAADDWSSDTAPPGFAAPITTVQLLALADEWSRS